MSNLLYVSVSPRGDHSASIQAAQVFLEALPPSVTVEHIDLFERKMPEVTLEIAAAKQKAFMGMELTDEERASGQPSSNWSMSSRPPTTI